MSTQKPPFSKNLDQYKTKKSWEIWPKEVTSFCIEMEMKDVIFENIGPYIMDSY